MGEGASALTTATTSGRVLGGGASRDATRRMHARGARARGLAPPDARGGALARRPRRVERVEGHLSRSPRARVRHVREGRHRARKQAREMCKCSLSEQHVVPGGARPLPPRAARAQMALEAAEGVGGRARRRERRRVPRRALRRHAPVDRGDGRARRDVRQRGLVRPALGAGGWQSPCRRRRGACRRRPAGRG